MCHAASARRSPGWPAQQWTGNQRVGRASVAEKAAGSAAKAAGPARAVFAAANTGSDADIGTDEQFGEGTSWTLDPGRTVLGSSLVA